MRHCKVAMRCESSHSSLLKVTFFLLDLNNNSLKYRTAPSLQSTPLATLFFLPRDAMHKRGLCRHAVCVCICVSVTFVSCINTNKNVFEICPPSDIQVILVFPCQTGWRYSDGTPPLTGASNVGEVNKKLDSGRISGFAAYRFTVLSTVRNTNGEV